MNEVRPLEGRRIDRESPRRRQQRTAGRIAPRTDERGQARHRPHGVPAAANPLHAVIETDRGRLGRAVVVREPDELLARDAAGRCDAIGRPLAHALGERVEADRIAVDVVAIDPSAVDQQMHDAECERRVGARQQRDVLVALVSGGAAVRVDGDQSRAAPLRLLRARPEMQVRRDRIAAPDQDQPAVDVRLDVHAHRRADNGRPAGLACGCADRPVEQRCAEAMEESPVHRRALQQPHRACIAVRQDRLGSVGRLGNRLETRRDLVQRLVPRDAGKAAFAFRADASHRIPKPVG